MNRIRELREDRDLRQADVSSATGIDQRTLSNYETGKTNPDSFALIKLADFFDVSIDYLIGRNTDNISKLSDTIKKIEYLEEELHDIKENLKHL
ncbi:MAG: helix-turn-helix domain-containing protein [Acutalibacteraceae bacterium]